METLGTLLAGTIAEPLGNLLLDLSAGVTYFAWLVPSMLLALRSVMLVAPDPPPEAVHSPRPAIVIEPEEEPLAPRKAA